MDTKDKQEVAKAKAREEAWSNQEMIRDPPIDSA